jgi:hypothetical protein
MTQNAGECIDILRRSFKSPEIRIFVFEAPDE